MEPLEFRSVTDLEEVAALADDDSLLLVSNGTAKQIKKINAKLGGGATTIYSVDNSSEQSASGGIAVSAGAADPTHLNLLDGDGNAVTAQQVYDAFMSGRVLVNFGSNGVTEMTSIRDINGTTAQVFGFIAILNNAEYAIGEVGE